ncbi:MAG: ATP phosphoribosyltransferase [Oscillospiraceae bacterium]|nr:ATP phosphoribosyltransferase [Oscillospiraceae bacterium]
MNYSDDVIRYDEQAILCLRSLYSRYGYEPYRMSRFEEYGLYADNKAFLSSGDVITFTGTSGKLMALRPDVTLSIVKQTIDDGTTKKLYYDETIYRPEGGEFKEQMQVGLEFIGDIDVSAMGEVLMLARQSLKELSNQSRLEISHMGFLSGLLQNANLNSQQSSRLLQSVSEKNIPEINALFDEYDIDNECREKLATLVMLYGSFDETIDTLREISINEETESALLELEEVYEVLKGLDAHENVNLDFTIVNDLNYYSGIIFQGFIEGIPKKVLSGGRYDELLRRFGKQAGAVGFAVYLDLLEQQYIQYGKADADMPTVSNDMINIALPKGRLGEDAYAVFESSGYGCPGMSEESRRLVFENPENGVRFFWVKPSDVSIYVERGVADIGVVGKDILLELASDVYELLDLDMGKCRICVAAEKGYIDKQDRTLKVATKFPNISRNYYESLGRDIDIITLNGSIELAPLLGLSDVIVDIVETGTTLRENNLEAMVTITDISARLISNKASYKFKHEAISTMCDKIQRG